MTCIVKYGLTQIWILRLFLSCLFEYRHVPLGGGGNENCPSNGHLEAYLYVNH